LSQRLATALIMSFLAFSSTVWSASLDTQFADIGYARIPATSPPEFSIGGCPLAGGGFIVAAISVTPQTQLITTRLTAQGDADLSYSNDGQAETSISIPAGLSFVTEHLATACQGLGNADPGDDRLLIAATIRPAAGNNPDSLTWMAKLNLSAGALDPSFGLGGQVVHNLTSVTPGGSAHEQVGGLTPGAAGEWLLTGQFVEVFEFEDRTGWLARIGADGQVLISRVFLLANGVHLERNAAAMVSTNGNLKVLGHGRVPVGISWIHLELAPDTLAVLNQSEGTINGLRLHRGRIVSSGVLAVAGRIGDAPKAVILRESGVSVLDLPAIPSLDGRSFSLGPFDHPVAITGGVGGRIVFAGGLTGITAPGERAYYLAMAALGNGGSVADQVETRFDLDGAGTIQRVPSGWSCSGRAPLQHFAGIATWGNSHMLLGSIETACDANLARDPLAARLDDLDRVFRDSFE
jgi:hypothetical protein